MGSGLHSSATISSTQDARTATQRRPFSGPHPRPRSTSSCPSLPASSPPFLPPAVVPSSPPSPVSGGQTRAPLPLPPPHLPLRPPELGPETHNRPSRSDTGWTGPGRRTSPALWRARTPGWKRAAPGPCLCVRQVSGRCPYAGKGAPRPLPRHPRRGRRGRLARP